MTTVQSPTTDLSAVRLTEGWQAVPMRSESTQYTVLEAEHSAAVLTLPVDATGPRALYLGLTTYPRTSSTSMQVRVAPDGAWQRVRPMRFVKHDEYAVQDAYIGTFDFKPNAAIQIRTEPRCRASVAYVRTDEPRAVEARHRNGVGVVFDTNMIMSSYQINEPDDLLVALNPYIDSDVSHIFWGTTVGTYSMLYPSEALGWHGQEQKTFMAWHREATANAMKMFMDRGVDPFQMAIDFAHANGIEIWANYRISKNHECDFADDYPGGRFLLKHQDKRVLEKNGEPHFQCVMSFAYPELREMAIRCLVEQAKYDVDGIFIDFCRKYPLIGWEKPVVDDFKKNTGHDPDKDPSGQWADDWFRHICTYVTQFMVELREALKPIEAQRGKRILIAVQTPGEWRFGSGIASAMKDAMDPVTWAQKGLIDIFAPSESTALMIETQCHDRFSVLLEDTQCKLWGAIGPQFRAGHGTKAQRAEYDWAFADTDPWRYMALAHDYYQQGAEGVFIWEAQDMPAVPQRWEIMRRMGDREFLRTIFGDKLGKFDGSHWVPQERVEPA